MLLTQPQCPQVREWGSSLFPCSSSLACLGDSGQDVVQRRVWYPPVGLRSSGRWSGRPWTTSPEWGEVGLPHPAEGAPWRLCPGAADPHGGSLQTRVFSIPALGPESKEHLEVSGPIAVQHEETGTLSAAAGLPFSLAAESLGLTGCTPHESPAGHPMPVSFAGRD